MKRVAWLLRRFAIQLGIAGHVGLALLLGIALAHRFVVMPAQARVIVEKKENAMLEALLVQKRLQPSTRRPEEKLNQFYSGLPAASASVMADALAKIHSLADAEALTLEQGDYRLSSEAEESLTRFEIFLPAKGGYPQLRRFLAKVLIQEPSLALSSASFSRPAIGDAVVEAQLRFTLFMRRP